MMVIFQVPRTPCRSVEKGHAKHTVLSNSRSRKRDGGFHMSRRLYSFGTHERFPFMLSMYISQNHCDWDTRISVMYVGLARDIKIHSFQSRLEVKQPRACANNKWPNCFDLKQE